jgi:Flp pilus assembly protein TadB
MLTLTRLITAALLIASAAAFATGAALEHHAATSENHPVQHAEATTGEHAASVEGAATDDSSAEHSSETLLGINPEATGLVVIAVAVSLVLAALILTVGSPLLAAGVALAMLAFTALDIREVTHQLNESHPGLAALAATIAMLHLLAGAAALLTTRDTRSQPGASPA